LEPGNGDVIDEPNGIYFYSDTGTYLAKIIAVNEVGCFDTASVKIKIEPMFAFFIPNAFSPNDDGINDYFSPKGEGLKTYEMFIFDRWGDQIFFTDKLTNQWDGRANDGKKIAPLGVYNYKVRVLDLQKTEHIYVGRVTLVR
jgi:gliding motility-associated-like protein